MADIDAQGGNGTFDPSDPVSSQPSIASYPGVLGDG